MPDPKKLTDLQRNWNIAKQYVKDSKGNSWFEFAIPLNMLLMELSYKQGGIL